MTRPGIELRSPGSLVNTLTIIPRAEETCYHFISRKSLSVNIRNISKCMSTNRNDCFYFSDDTASD